MNYGNRFHCIRELQNHNKMNRAFLSRNGVTVEVGTASSDSENAKEPHRFTILHINTESPPREKHTTGIAVLSTVYNAITTILDSHNQILSQKKTKRNVNTKDHVEFLEKKLKARRQKGRNDKVLKDQTIVARSSNEHFSKRKTLCLSMTWLRQSETGLNQRDEDLWVLILQYVGKEYQIELTAPH